MPRLPTELPRWIAAVMLSAAASLGCIALSGCERKERVVDIEVPGASVEVDRNIDTREVEVKAEEK